MECTYLFLFKLYTDIDHPSDENKKEVKIYKSLLSYSFLHYLNILKITRGNLVDEAYIEYSSWASMIVRLYHNGELEVEWTIGPFPSDMIGRETIIRYTIDGNDVQYRDTGMANTYLTSHNVIYFEIMINRTKTMFFLQYYDTYFTEQCIRSTSK